MFPIRVDALFYKEAGLDYHTEAHTHRVWQWFFCLHGGLSIIVDGTMHELHPEQSLLIAPDAQRETWCRQKAPGYLVAVVDPGELDLSAVQGRVLPLPPELREDIHALIAELRSPGATDARLLSSALLLRLLIGLKRSAAAAPSVRASALNAHEHGQVVAQADAFMLRNLFRPLRRSEIAAAVRLSEPHLARLFRAATGRSVVDRLTELRIAHAKTLLLESTLSVTRIAGEVGLSSFSHFSKTFKSAVGVSPSDYRRSGGRAYS